MPLALLIIAIAVVVIGVKGNYAAFGSQFEQDVMGNGQGGGFLTFIVGLIGIAAFFRLIGAPNAGRAFLILVLIVFILQNQNILTTIEGLGSSLGVATQGSAPSSQTSSTNQAPGSTSTPAASTAGGSATTGTPPAS